MNLTKTQWPLGWVPDADPVNGDPNCLIRMDNLQQDEYGVLSLVRPIRQVTPGAFSDYVDQIYSKLIGSNEVLWASIGGNSTQIVRSNLGDFSDTVTVGGGGGGRTFFGDCLGQTLILSGSQRLKDDLTQTLLYPLGLQTCPKPLVQGLSQATLAFYASNFSNYVVQRVTGTWQMVEGISFVPFGTAADGIHILATADTLRAIALLNIPVTNTYAVDSVIANQPANDSIQVTITPDDSSQVKKIRLTFLMDAFDMYYYEWDGKVLNQGLSQQTTLSINRGAFKRFAATAPDLDWSKINQIQVSIETLSSIHVAIGFVGVIGGGHGPLNGVYQYIAVAIRDNGSYQAKSPCSIATAPVTIINGAATLNVFGADLQATEIWYFRISVAGTQLNLPSNLDSYLRVGVSKPGVQFIDKVSDTDAILLDIELNPFLLSLYPLTDGNGITEPIIGVEGIYNERMIYLTPTSVLISDPLDPDAVDSRYTIKVESDPTEGNLWLKKLTNNVLILGTNKDLYEISGTLLPLPDGTLDATIIKIGEKYPPLTTDCCAITGGGIAYVASDGIRVTSGSNSQLISPQLKLLFQGESRAGFAPVVISRFSDFRIAAGKTKLLCIFPLQDGTRQLLIYDFILQTWRIQITNPVTVYATQKDRVLLGYNNTGNVGGSGQIFELDAAGALSGFLDTSGNSIVGFQVNFTTVYDHNQQPRNRKDTFTLKLTLDTGGRTVSVYTGIDGGAFAFVQDISATGLTTIYIPMNAFTLGKRYAFKIVDRNYLTKFRLYELTLEYDPRPEQLDYLRIQPSNLGTITRKRFTNYAFVIDTLGNPITFTPLVDNSNAVTPANSTVNTQVKQTFIHYFTEETLGTDISGILSGGVFEFYGLNTEEIVSEKLPVPTEFLVIPPNDYGSPHRKRHSSYKFQINTRGKDVLFTPILDGLSYEARVFNTTTKRTVEYFFETYRGDIIGIDIGGSLSALQGTPFEFYGVVIPEEVEVLPARLEYLRIPNNNFGYAARKRVRTLPLVIDTYGQGVLFTPIVDGLAQNNSTLLVSVGKTTLFHYFIDDSFGIDYGGQLVAQNGQPFEFYELGKPEDVEVLPVAKRYDQIGPLRWDKIAKIFDIRIRLIMTGSTTSIPIKIGGNDNFTVPANIGPYLYDSSFPVNPLRDQIYEIQLPKSVNTDIFRLILGPTTDPFHRFDVQIRVSLSGMESDSQWIPIR